MLKRSTGVAACGKPETSLLAPASCTCLLHPSCDAPNFAHMLRRKRQTLASPLVVLSTLAFSVALVDRARGGAPPDWNAARAKAKQAEVAEADPSRADFGTTSNAGSETLDRAGQISLALGSTFAAAGALLMWTAHRRSLRANDQAFYDDFVADRRAAHLMRDAGAICLISGLSAAAFGTARLLWVQPPAEPTATLTVGVQGHF